MVLVNVSISWPNGISVDYEVQLASGRMVPVPRVPVAVSCCWGRGCPPWGSRVSGWSEPQDILPEAQRVMLLPRQLGCCLIPAGWEAVLV